MAAALNDGGLVLEKTLVGRALNLMKPLKIPWDRQRLLWRMASRWYANGVKPGELVRIYINAERYSGAESMLHQIEMKILREKGAEATIFVVEKGKAILLGTFGL